jgi:hypothetical protein
MAKVQFQVNGLDSNTESIFNEDVTFDGNIDVNSLSIAGVDIFTAIPAGPQGDTGPAGPATIVQNEQGSAYTVASSDNGKFIDITTGGVTISTTTAMTAGQNFVIYNDSASNQTITQGDSITLRQAGTANTGNRTLAQYGIATVLCVASNTYVVAGTGLS